ncbi:MAG: GIY-YIG nuclease family protein [Clostridia bacterium]|nr:GIY-YIG nuclease family protein [Clostridia bacterium]
MEKGHYTYMLRCADNTIYSGYAVDPIARLETHNSGKGAKYTRARLPVKLVYYEKFDTKSEALRREIELKKLKRVEKEKLINSFYINFKVFV